MKKLLFACSTGLAFAWGLSAASPNIILFLADDQGWTRTSVPMDRNRPGSRSDFYQTPALERLANQGMRFSQAYAVHQRLNNHLSLVGAKIPAKNPNYDPRKDTGLDARLSFRGGRRETI